jgi:hypothetical protein
MQYGTNGAEYYLGDVLGWARQMEDANGDVTLGRMYKPYGAAGRLSLLHTLVQPWCSCYPKAWKIWTCWIRNPP